MKIEKCLILLATGGVMVSAQNRTAQSRDLTIKAIVHEVKYCLGPTSFLPSKQQPGASDITLRLSLKLLYENHRSEPIIVPLGFRSLARMMVAGQQDAETVLSRENPYDPTRVVELARPAPPYFVVIPGGKSELQYFGELVDVGVRSSDRQLLGKTVQISITRDHGLLPVEKLQARWKSYGTVWTGIQDSEPVSISIPESPATVDCGKDFGRF